MRAFSKDKRLFELLIYIHCGLGPGLIEDVADAVGVLDEEAAAAKEKQTGISSFK